MKYCPVNSSLFLFHQILTSVLPIPVRVMTTLIVTIMMVLIAAPVSQDLLAMAPFVKVCAIYHVVSKDLLQMEHLAMVGDFPAKIS